MKTRVAFQGELGAYSEAAIAQQFGSDYEPIPCRTFRGVLDSVRDGIADYGVLPIENSTTGPISELQNLLKEFGAHCQIVGEVHLRVCHCLLGLSGSSLENIRTVFSHPQALAQCQEFLDELGAELKPFYDTAGAAKFIAEQADPTLAAIASRQAASRYHLTIVREAIESNPQNITRFIVLQAFRPLDN